jgi:predicted DNA-binding protein
MATRGRPKGEETRMLHVRVPVRLLDQLDTLQFITKRTTSDVLRECLETYLKQHGNLLEEAARTRDELQRAYSQTDGDQGSQ